MNQVLGQLLGRGHSKVGGIAAADRARVVQVKHRPGKISAIVEEQIEVAAIRLVVESLDKRFILLRCCFDFESINLAVVKRAYKLNPISPRSFAIAPIRNKIQQMFATPRISQRRFRRAVRCFGDFRDVIHGVEIRQKWTAIQSYPATW